MLDPFRIALIVIFLLVVTISGYHRFDAAKSGEPISRRDEGRILFLSLRIAGLLVWVGALLYLMNPLWMSWASIPLPDGVGWLGAAFGLGSHRPSTRST